MVGKFCAFKTSLCAANRLPGRRQLAVAQNNVLQCAARRFAKGPGFSPSSNPALPWNSAAFKSTRHRTTVRPSDAAPLVNRDFVSMSTFSRDDIERILWTALELKQSGRDPSKGSASVQERINESGSPLGRTTEDRSGMWMPKPGAEGNKPQHLSGLLSHLIFETPDIHQRLSVEAGLHLFGGATSYLAPGDVHFTTPEALADTMTTFAACSNLIWCRIQSQEFVDQMARECSVPVVNVGTRLENPIVALSHLLTLYETYGTLRSLTFAWIGPPTAVLNSLLLSATHFGARFKIALLSSHADGGAMPTGSTNALKVLDSGILAQALRVCAESDSDPEIHSVSDVQDALWRTHVVLCDNAEHQYAVDDAHWRSKWEVVMPAKPTLPKNVKSLIRRDAEEAEIRRTPSLAAFMDGSKATATASLSVASGNNTSNTAVVEYQELRIEKSMVEQADLEWTFLHSLPRTPKEVSSAIHYGENARSFASVANRKWICAAIALQLLHAYRPKTRKPDFMAF